MNLVLFIASFSESSRRFLDEIRLLPSGINVQVSDSRGGFIKALRQPKTDFLTAVLFDPSHDDLEAVRAARQLLVNIPLLLVLSDQDAPTMALAHRLLPTYITYVDSDPSQLLAVVKRLLPAVQEARKF